MVGTKLKQLIEQINFLIEVENDSLNECVQELGSLLVFLEQQAAKAQDEEVFGGLEIIREKLSEDYKKMCESYKDEINYLKNQQTIIEQALTIEKKNINNFEEIEKLIMEDVGNLEPNDAFKARVKKTNHDSRTDFLSVLEEIKESIEEGSIDDLANYFQALAIDEADNFYNKEDNEHDTDEHLEDLDNEEQDYTQSHDFDLSNNEKVIKTLKNFSDPYFTENNGSLDETKK